MTTTLKDVVSGFRQAELALSDIIKNAESLGTAEAKVTAAVNTVENARNDLSMAQNQVTASAGKLGDLAEEVQVLAARFAKFADVLDEIDPVEMIRIAEETQSEVHKLGTRITQALANETNRLTAESVRLANEVTAARADLGTLATSITTVTGDVSTAKERISVLETSITGLSDGVAANTRTTRAVLLVAALSLALSVAILTLSLVR
ncbi:hypothetical protein WBG06_26415 [Nocardioides sp. CCNWLW239]|uniref:hypothetical protein n=1 Tax=Nocardioides sp. CCNWLW239 TaxID=3128902 RepID=UPI0030175CAC